MTTNSTVAHVNTNASEAQQLTTLKSKPVITLDDIHFVERHILFMVASELWAKLDTSARKFLMHETPPVVRCAAAMAAQEYAREQLFPS